ncbi:MULTISPECIES: hypothetical protein [Loigolactobacillus]|uniref:Uncharacterized protein n=1 Tax=Loigolactobacillus backii TaxID=375175 RepID=A0A192H2B0_9LACO|nr:MULTISPECIES: hypothetical protein [Loigolactobacillus]ANK62081.1 hypothetical protein AYR53_04440 [Loigolactobacillus backii]ANK68725.1 hypothetical protein AYR56_00285 [Loigolactobacillus backii]MDA5386730.1 hypothetical protein [Loigolactobacillus backii]MDA5389255.1 hypothetical protein [Loigolactobacillus backii]
MLTKEDMSDADFQKLLQITLMDLRIRRTLLENDIADQRADLRTLEQDEAIEKLEQQIQPIRRDYDHYHQFIDPEVKPAKDSYFSAD